MGVSPAGAADGDGEGRARRGRSGGVRLVAVAASAVALGVALAACEAPTDTLAKPTPTATRAAAAAAAPAPAPDNRPGPDSTGVRAGVTLTQLALGNDDRVTYNNTVLENKNVTSSTGRIRFNEPKNLVIRNLKIDGVLNIDGGSNVTIEDVEADLISITNTVGATVRRADVSPNTREAGADCFHVTSYNGGRAKDILIENSWCHQAGITLFPGFHYDGIQSLGSDNLTLRGNFFELPFYDSTKTGVDGAGSNAAIFLQGTSGDGNASNNENNAVVENNWIVGSQRMFHVNGKNIKIRNNKLGPFCTQAQLSLPTTGILCTKSSPYLRTDNNPDVTDESGNVSLTDGAPVVLR